MLQVYERSVSVRGKATVHSLDLLINVIHLHLRLHLHLHLLSAVFKRSQLVGDGRYLRSRDDESRQQSKVMLRRCSP